MPWLEGTLPGGYGLPVAGRQSGGESRRLGGARWLRREAVLDEAPLAGHRRLVSPSVFSPPGRHKDMELCVTSVAMLSHGQQSDFERSEWGCGCPEDQRAGRRAAIVARSVFTFVGTGLVVTSAPAGSSQESPIESTGISG